MNILPLPWALLPRYSSPFIYIFFGQKSVLPVHALLENRADYVSSLDYHDWQITSHPFRRKADMEKAQNR
jgi:hypothetical protein